MEQLINHVSALIVTLLSTVTGYLVKKVVDFLEQKKENEKIKRVKSIVEDIVDSVEQSFVKEIKDKGRVLTIQERNEAFDRAYRSISRILEEEGIRMCKEYIVNLIEAVVFQKKKEKNNSL